MTNLLLFAVTVALYMALWHWLEKPQGYKEAAKRLAPLALLCLPFNINGNVITVLGNAKAEKSIFSVFSLYQNASNVAVAVLAGYQNASENAVAVLAGYQNASNVAVAGLALYQKVSGKERSFGAFSELKAD